MDNQGRKSHHNFPKFLPRSNGIITLLLLCLLWGWFSPSHALTIRGSLITQGKGYQDLEQNDHFIVAQGLRFHCENIGSDALSFHGYLQYYGDTSSDPTVTGTMRVYHGYLNYERTATPLRFKAGRFFLFRGVAIGVLDGAEVSYRLNRQWELTGFGGYQGPLNREWEFAHASESPMYGGEIRWQPNIPNVIKHPVVSLSYTQQDRDQETIRQLMGVSLRFRLLEHWQVLNVLHLRMSGNPFRRALTRWHYTDEQWQIRTEAAYVVPNVADYSWFSNFEGGGYFRLRAAVEHYFTPRKWGLGISTLMYGSDEYGLQLGPVLIFPYGRAGYHFSSGNQAHNNTWWGFFRISPVSYLDLYTYAAIMEFEWQDMAIDAQETTMMNAGFAFRPPFLNRTEWKLECQNYQTPQLDADRRIIASFRWNFEY